jgi:hypothetical protein
LQDATKREDLLKPTSPIAQKAALASDSQIKVGIRPMARIKPKPLQTLVGSGKVCHVLLIVFKVFCVEAVREVLLTNLCIA